MPLTIAVAQPLIVAHDVARNALRHAEVVRVTEARVVVFPELSLTGYELDSPTIDVRDPRLGPIVDACAVTGSVARSAHRSMAWATALTSRCSRSTVSVHPSPTGRCGSVATSRAFRRGAAAGDHRGRRMAPRGMDAYVAGMVESAEEADAPAERARRVATRHRVWVAIASFARRTGGGFERTAGGSGIRDRDGISIADAGPAVGVVARGRLTDEGDRPPAPDRQATSVVDPVMIVPKEANP